MQPLRVSQVVFVLMCSGACTGELERRLAAQEVRLESELQRSAQMEEGLNARIGGLQQRVQELERHEAELQAVAADLRAQLARTTRTLVAVESKLSVLADRQRQREQETLAVYDGEGNYVGRLVARSGGALAFTTQAVAHVVYAVLHEQEEVEEPTYAGENVEGAEDAEADAGWGAHPILAFTGRDCTGDVIMVLPPAREAEPPAAVLAQPSGEIFAVGGGVSKRRAASFFDSLGAEGECVTTDYVAQGLPMERVVSLEAFAPGLGVELMRSND